MKNKLTVIIITYNEEKNIERSIKSALFADEVIVLDSNSSDKTVQIAEELGAKVFQHPFKNHGHQKNYAESLATHSWIFSLDADEAISDKLKKNILIALGKPEGPFVYSVNRLNHFCGKPIFHGGWFPDHNTRLYKKEHATWTEPNVHEKLTPTQGTLPTPLKGLLLHYTFTTVDQQVQTNMKYAALGAQDLINRKKSTMLPLVIIKPIGKFIECYLLKMGFLDGYSGFIIAINAAHSIFTKYVIARSLK